MASTQNALVRPAPDCPAVVVQVPPTGKRRSRANVEYDLLTAAPYHFDHKTFSHAVHLEMAQISGKPALDFAAFHAKGQPCIRASPLTKRYGWAAHYAPDGTLALIDPASAACGALADNPTVSKTDAMRTKRA